MADYDELLNLSAEIGELLLQNGAEIYRVEESMERLFTAYGVESQVYCGWGWPRTRIKSSSAP